MKRARGFSIVELVVVIVVIAILVTIAVVSYTWVRKDAEASAYAATIKQIEKGLRLKYTREGVSRWPRDTDMASSIGASGGNPNMARVAKHQLYREYIGDIPESLTKKVTFGYDNDGDTIDLNVCHPNDRVNTWRGVNLSMNNMDRGIMQAIDDQLDDGNLLCGRVRAVVTNTNMPTLVYILSDKDQL